MIDPSVCRHENLVDHPEPPGGYIQGRHNRPTYVKPYPSQGWQHVTFKVMRCVDCGLPGEVPT